LVEAGDDEAMAKAVCQLLANSAQYSATSAAARRLAERSSWPQVRNRWEEELSLLLPGVAIP
jgi:glycosyltransferase involved in cell wall biosynthesis